jgi:hypothetical protein
VYAFQKHLYISFGPRLWCDNGFSIIFSGSPSILDIYYYSYFLVLRGLLYSQGSAPFSEKKNVSYGKFLFFFPFFRVLCFKTYLHSAYLIDFSGEEIHSVSVLQRTIAPLRCHLVLNRTPAAKKSLSGKPSSEGVE